MYLHLHQRSRIKHTLFWELIRIHCGRFKADDIWFLYSNNEFDNRELRLGTCPVCGNYVGELVEHRKADGRIFHSTFTKRKLDRLIKVEKKNIDYTSKDCHKQNSKKKLLAGFMELIQYLKIEMTY